MADFDKGLQTYFGRIARFPVLDRKTEQRLAKRARRGDKAARDRLVESHLRFVVKIASKYKGYGIRLADLIAEGNLGLLEAVRRFDVDRGLRFMTYAAYWIRAYVLAHVLRQWSLVGVGTGPLQSKMFFRLASTRNRLEAEEQGDGGAVQKRLAAHFGTTEERVQQMSGRLGGRDASLDAQLFTDAGTSMLDFLADDRADQEQSLSDSERDLRVRALIAGTIERLDPRERMIFEERLMAEDATTLAELGTRMGLSRERVRQLEERVKAKLRLALEPLAEAA
jgi:RNA polymerase sigma-32 factor